MSASIEPGANSLLARLSTDARRSIYPSLKSVALPISTVVQEAGKPSEYVYFPADCIVSILNLTEDGAAAEIAVVGFEGMVGITVFMGGERSTSRSVVQSAGNAFRLPAEQLRKTFNHCPKTRSLLLQYTQTLIVQMAQTAVCNRHHTIDQQLCRWLLLSLDRLPGNQLIMTQELIANMLGVRREGVTEAAGKLQRLGAISYRRGKITVLDRAMIERLSCECYEVVEREVMRINHPKDCC